MKRPKITYANVVATMALFIALGGVSWAATSLPKNSVGSKQLKKNAVTNAKIKNNAVTSRKIKSNSIISSKIKNGAIQGADINLGSLGKVPSAAVADSAANRFTTSAKAGVSASDNDPATARAAATEVPVYTEGAFTVYGKCFKDANDDRVYVEMFVKTSVDSSLFIGYNDGGNLNTSTVETDRFLTDEWTANDSLSYDYDYDATLLVAPNGQALRISNVVGVRNGNPAGGAPSAYPAEESCIFTTEGTKFSM